MAAEGFLRSDLAPAARTLVDVLEATAPAHGDAPAIDDGSTVLTYRELLVAVRAAAAGLAGAGIGPGDRVGVRIPSGTAELYTAILAVLAAGAAYVPVDVDDPDERAQTVFREAGVAAGAHRGRPRRAARARRDAAAADARRRRLDHLHVGLHGRAQGRRGHAPVGRRVRRRRGAPVPAGRRRSARATACWPGCRSRSTRAARRCGSRGGTAPAWSPRRARWCAPAWTSGPWLVAQGITVISTVPTLAGLWRAEELAGVRLLIFGGEACPPELVARLVGDGREVWNTYGPDRGDRRRVRARCSPATGRSGSGTRSTAGTSPSSAPDGVAGRRRASVGELIIGGVGLARYLDPAKDAEKYAPADDARLGAGVPQRRPGAVRARGAGVRRAGRRPGQGRRPTHRAGRGRLRAARRCRASRSGRGAVRRTPAGTVGARRLPRAGGRGRAGPRRRPRTASRGSLPAALVPLLAPSTPSRPAGPGRSTATRCRGRSRVPTRTSAPAVGLTPTTAQWVARAVDGGARGRGGRSATTTSSRPAAAASSPRSWCRALRERFPTVTVADVYEYPRIGDLARRLDEFEPTVVADAAGRRARRRSGPSWSRPCWPLPLAAARRAAVADLAARRRRGAASPRPVRPGCPSCPGSGGGWRSAGWCSSARSAAWAPRCSSRGRCCVA